MKFRKIAAGAMGQLNATDNEDAQLIIDSYRSTPKDAHSDYRFVVMLDGKVFGLSHKNGRKLAIAILKELSK